MLMEGYVLQYILGAIEATQAEMLMLCPMLCQFRGLPVRFSLFMTACIAMRTHEVLVRVIRRRNK